MTSPPPTPQPPPTPARRGGDKETVSSSYFPLTRISAYTLFGSVVLQLGDQLPVHISADLARDMADLLLRKADAADRYQATGKYQ